LESANWKLITTFWTFHIAARYNRGASTARENSGVTHVKLETTFWTSQDSFFPLIFFLTRFRFSP